MKKTIITITTLFALMGTPALVSAAEASAGDKAKAGINSVADWTVSHPKISGTLPSRALKISTHGPERMQKRKHRLNGLGSKPIKAENGYKKVIVRQSVLGMPQLPEVQRKAQYEEMYALNNNNTEAWHRLFLLQQTESCMIRESRIAYVNDTKTTGHCCYT